MDKFCKFRQITIIIRKSIMQAQGPMKTDEHGQPKQDYEAGGNMQIFDFLKFKIF